jgi:hypothetical protein
MLGRSTPLIFPVLLGMMLVMADQAQAHRLNAEASVLPNRSIQIESWFSTGEAAKGARVQVFRDGGQLLTEGRLDDQGIFIFSYKEPQALKIVISAGPEHRKELSIVASELPGAGQPDLAASAPSEGIPGVPVPLVKRESGISIKDVILGIAFLLAAAAFWLSWRNARKLRQPSS